MKVIIAEKPSVARSIAAIVGATTKKEGYMEGGEWAVTWAFGHLVGLAMPESYGFTGFRRENLPILPDSFILQPRQIREGKEYKADPAALKQLKIIGELFNQADSIIVATDAGREGELIFRYIYAHLKCRKPFQRLWISSLTDRAIREGMDALRPGGHYDNLFASARARSQADWVVGINASQALSITAGSGVWSLGRVQTPTLAMICARYLENRDFKAQTYFRLKLHTGKDATAFAAFSADRYDERTAADEVLSRVLAAKQVRVLSVEKREARQEPPLLYDLTTLQKEANSRHGFTAEETLSVAQTLYEAKLISYPRTGSRHLSADVFAEVPALIGRLRSHPRLGKYAAALSAQSLNPRSVDDKKVTDHHALIITEITPGNLSAEERTIYDMVAARMLESFSGVCVKENTTAALDADGVAFTAKGSTMLMAGWRGVLGTTEEADEDMSVLPALFEGDVLKMTDCELQERQTKPRPLHTESSLLSAMEGAGREVEDDQQRNAMKECGIGTPATRAAIIETLLSREYMRREKKSLVPTDKGMAVYTAVKDKKIADVSMTGQWESALAMIEAGEMDAATFHRGIEVYAAQITSELLEARIEGATAQRPACPCPKCKSGQVVFFPKVAKCNDEGCGLMIFRSIAGKELTDADLTALFSNGRTRLIKGFTSKAGKKFEAAVMLDADSKAAFDFPERKPAKGKPK